MNNFRQKKFRILVATDIAARGLDVPHIEHVINFDLPQVAEDYIHRLGRTARAGAEGSALCFVSPQDGRKWHAIECLLNPDAKKASNDRGSYKKRPRKFSDKSSRKERFTKDKRGKSAPKKKHFDAQETEDRQDSSKFDTKKSDNRKFDKTKGKKRPFKKFDGKKRDDQNQDQKHFAKKKFHAPEETQGQHHTDGDFKRKKSKSAVSGTEKLKRKKKVRKNKGKPDFAKRHKAKQNAAA